jgi:hypothetical protein
MFQRHTVMALILLLALFAGLPGMAAARRGDSQPNSKPARPQLMWSVPRVVQSLQPGQTTTLQVTLTSDRAIQGVNLRVVGGLERVLSVSPRSFDLAAGVSRTITLTMTLPSEHRRSRAGVVQVRMGNRNLPQSLKVLIQSSGDDSNDEERGGNPPAIGRPDNPGRGRPGGDD